MHLQSPIRLCLLIPLLLTACGSDTQVVQPPKSQTPYSASLDLSQVSISQPESALPDNWYQGAVFMEIYVRGYKDSDGDGIGDLQGLMQQLDYLQQLGVQGLWLMPINASYDHDHGYAVSDYRSLETQYGSQADLAALLEAAHARGMGIIMDYVINHSAIDNPLFLDSDQQLGDKRDWYIWRDSNPGWTNWDGNPSWHPGRQGYFYGVFWENMPDFNLKNETVLAYHHDSLRYWLNQGLDGFRFDAVGQLVENGQYSYESQPENHAIMYDIQQLVTNDYQHRYMVCEEPTDAIGAAQSDACGSAFAFGFNDAVRASVKAGRVSSDLADTLQQLPLARMGVMLGNHDAFAGVRLIEDFDGDLARYRLAAATQLTLPGQPFIYYGEEIGMGHSAGNSGDWALRAPMSWTASGGFTTGSPFRAYASNKGQYNVQDQQAAADSLWHFYQRLIAARKANPALRLGTLQLLQSDRVLAYTRQYEDDTLLVLLNYAEEASPLTLDLDLPNSSLSPLDDWASDSPTTDADGSLSLTLPAQAIRIYRLPAGV
ncbi:alpha-amylase family glycosyl hydrolase [Pseudaeromonas sp. ZJS20]|uniref:alpha-amylase family glycosyl hydrolase n=1 Tax=Pseudaeromonas aegiceratis TaxID=3153928 RepID=UPI00390CBF96